MADFGERWGRAAFMPMERPQLVAAFLLAVLLHLSFAFWLNVRPHNLRPFPALSVIDVKLLPGFTEAPAVKVETSPLIDESKALPLSKPSLPIEDMAPTPAVPVMPQTSPTEKPLPTITTSEPPPILNNEAGSAAGQFPSTDKGKDYIPSQWALEPPLKTERLEGLGLVGDMDCLRALSEDCAALRKEVFAEFELTEMEKVWTAQRADTGMPAAFYGMSEREIRLKIGAHIAGENGFMLLPGIAIDGPIWDMMHGVKKGCGIKRGINSEGRYDIIKSCPDSLPAARDKKYYIPPKD